MSGRHGNEDVPRDSGRGKEGDGQDPAKHGSEPMPEQGSDGQDPNK